MLRHHVVAEFVDVGNQLAQRQRGRVHQPYRITGRAAIAHHAGERAAQPQVHGLQHAAGVAGGVGESHGPDAFAAFDRVAAAEMHPVRVGKLGLQRAAPVVAALGAEGHLCVHLHIGNRRLAADAGDAAVGLGGEGEDQRLEVDQQAVGCDVVGAERLAVEFGGVAGLGREDMAVEHDVAAHAVHAPGLQRGKGGGNALQHQLGVAAALDVQVAIQHTVFERAVGIEAGFPGVVGAQGVERGKGGDQLHDRSRVHQRMGPVAQARQAPAVGPRHIQAHRVVRHLGPGQGVGNVRGQALGQHGGGCSPQSHSAQAAPKSGGVCGMCHRLSAIEMVADCA